MARLLGGRLLTATTVLLVGPLVGSLSGSAVADTWSGTDPAHDVQAIAYSPDPEPCGTTTALDGSGSRTADLRRLTVEHRVSEVVLTARLRRYRPTAHTYATFHLRTPTGRFLVDVSRVPGERMPSVLVAREPHYPKPTGPCHASSILVTGLPCAHLEAEIARPTSTVSVSVPRACLGRPAWVQAGVVVNSSRGSVYYSDEWGQRRGRTPSPVPAYGPRVVADRRAAGTRPPLRSPAA